MLTHLTHIPIDRDGTPRGFVGTLPEMAREVLDITTGLYESIGFEEPWISYLATNDGRPVGTCAFKGPPQDGRVEIAYFTFPEFEGQGIATAMASMLVERAIKTQPNIIVAAQTLPERNASHRILEKLGFRHVDTVLHEEDGIVWEWQLSRSTSNERDDLKGSIREVIGALDRAPAIVIPLVREMSSSMIKRRPQPGRWSVHEHACHLAAVHDLFFRRLDEILENPEPLVEPYTPGADGPDDTLLQMELDEALASYTADRRELVARLENLTLDDWQRTASHAEYSHYSVFIMFRHLALHDLFHAYRIEELVLRKEW